MNQRHLEDVFNSLHTLVAASCLEVVEFHPESSSRCSTAVQGPCVSTRFCLIAASAQDTLSPKHGAALSVHAVDRNIANH